MITCIRLKVYKERSTQGYKNAYRSLQFHFGNTNFEENKCVILIHLLAT